MKVDLVIPLKGTLPSGKGFHIDFRVPCDLFIRGLKQYNEISDGDAFQVMTNIVEDKGWRMTEAPTQTDSVGMSLNEIRDMLDGYVEDGILPSEVIEMRRKIFGA